MSMQKKMVVLLNDYLYLALLLTRAKQQQDMRNIKQQIGIPNEQHP
jgi:hypothetical protein